MIGSVGSNGSNGELDRATKSPSSPEAMTQTIAIDVLESRRNAFLTGPPGAGKSWLLRKFVTAARRDRSVAITASTGVAGTHIGGTTLHSWAGLGARDTYTTKDIATIADNNRVANRIRSADVLVIDEVSMLHVATFEAANAVCKRVRHNSKPFGGMQVVLCGDFFQLPPVSKGSETEFIYGCTSWRELRMAVLYLSEQFRQSDDSLVELLTNIRLGTVTEEHLEQLRQRMHAALADGVVPTRLHTHNVDVDRVNAVELSGLKGPAKRYSMTANGPERAVATLRNSCLAPAELELKKGAAVMFVKNSLTDGYVNGTLGTVVDFDGDLPKVRTDRGAEIVVQPQEWAAEDGKGQKVASVKQLPLRLAWAISVHKSQGMSLSAAEIDLSRAFVEGLGYVALSRVTTMAGIRLLGLNQRALMVSQRARQIDNELRSASDDVLAGEETIDVDEPAISETMTLF